MLTLKNVYKSYGSENAKVEALKNVSLTIKENDFTVIIGKSGSGKTTLMNIIGGLDKPDSGSVFYNENDITNLSNDDLAEYRNKKTGFVFQSFYLEPSFTVLENVCMPLIISGMDKKNREEIGKKQLSLFGLENRIFHKAGDLSGGEKQRVCIARALINNPEVVLADEPTGNLDSENGEEVLKILREIANQGKMVILVTHNVEDAKKYADIIIELKDGRVCFYEDKR